MNCENPSFTRWPTGLRVKYGHEPGWGVGDNIRYTYIILMLYNVTVPYNTMVTHRTISV